MAPSIEIEKVIRPATRLDLVIRASEEENWVDVRTAVIYDVFPEEGYIIASQTDPPILKSMVGDLVEATFLWYPEPQAEPERCAFSTVIEGLIDYELSPGNIVQAIRLRYPKYVYRRNLRFSYRVNPVKEYPLSLQIPGIADSLPIIDISCGGVCFSHQHLSSLEKLKKGDRLKVKIKFDDEREMTFWCEVIRKFKKPELPKLSFMALKFLNLKTADREFLASVIKKIERIILRKRAGLI